MRAAQSKFFVKMITRKSMLILNQTDKSEDIENSRGFLLQTNQNSNLLLSALCKQDTKEAKISIKKSKKKPKRV